MNDHELESRLRSLPTPTLPAAWRASILALARREARLPASDRSKTNWPTLLLMLARRCRRNPITCSGLAMLWVIILILKAGTPSDPDAERLIARMESSPPPQIMALRDEILLAQALENQSSPSPIQRP